MFKRAIRCSNCERDYEFQSETEEGLYKGSNCGICGKKDCEEIEKSNKYHREVKSILYITGGNHIKLATLAMLENKSSEELLESWIEKKYDTVRKEKIKKLTENQ